MKIFVSYARANKERVLEILQPLGIHDVWIDQELKMGDEWWRKIEEQIAAGDCFLFMISPQSLSSDYCLKEFEVARQLAKPIAPVQLEPTEIPPELSNLQIVDATSDATQNATVAIMNGIFEIERMVFNPLRARTKSDAPLGRLDISSLIFVTTNLRKKADYESILGSPIQSSPIYIPCIQHKEVVEVAAQKVQAAFSMLNTPVLVEQSGISIRAWGGLPGGISEVFVLPLGLHNICKMMTVHDDKYAEVVSVIAFTDGTINRTFAGRLEGSIAPQPRYSESPNSWDSIFIPHGFTETIAEMSMDKRLSISMRRRAMVQFMRFLQSNYDVH